MVRPKKQEIWKFYQDVGDTSTKCNFCEKVYKQKHVNKMANHLLVCAKAPIIVKNQIQDINKERPSTSHSNETTFPVSEVCVAEKIGDLKEHFAKALFISGIPMSMVDHPLWKSFFELLKFKLPTRKVLATSYLEKLYSKMDKEISEDIAKAPFFHIQCDGWSNIRNEGIINFLISKPEIIFIKSLNTEDNRHTSEYLASEIEKVIRKYDEKKTFVMVGDNARNLQKSFEILKTKYPWLVVLNCAAHTLNLLCGDVMKVTVIKACIDLATEVIKCIKKSQVLSALLNKIRKDKEINGETLKLPCKTRWGSHVAALRSLKVNKAALQNLAVHEHSQPTSNVKSTILDDGFWIMVDQCLNIMEPISQAIFKLEGDSYNISKVYMTFKNIFSKLLFAFTSTTILETSDVEFLKTAVEQRTAQVLKPIHYAAYMLDPKAEGHELTQHQEMEAMEFIQNLATFFNIDCLVDIAEYKAKEGIWGRQFIWKAAETVDTVLWWKGICGSSPLSKVALRILTAPCTSAATERSFSIHGFIHNAKRNRLTTERAAQITSLAYNWHLRENKDSDKNVRLSTDFDTNVNDSFSDDFESEDESNLTELNELEYFDSNPSTSTSRNQEPEFIDVTSNINLSDEDD